MEMAKFLFYFEDILKTKYIGTCVKVISKSLGDYFCPPCIQHNPLRSAEEEPYSALLFKNGKVVNALEPYSVDVLLEFESRPSLMVHLGEIIILALALAFSE